MPCDTNPVDMSIVRPPTDNLEEFGTESDAVRPHTSAPESEEDCDMNVCGTERTDASNSSANQTKEEECVSAMLSLGTPRSRTHTGVNPPPFCDATSPSRTRSPGQSTTPIKPKAMKISPCGITIDLSHVEPPSTPPPPCSPPAFKLEPSALPISSAFTPLARSLMKTVKCTDARAFNFAPQRRALMEIPRDGMDSLSRISTNQTLPTASMCPTIGDDASHLAPVAPARACGDNRQ